MPKQPRVTQITPQGDSPSGRGSSQNKMGRFESVQSEPLIDNDWENPAHGEKPFNTRFYKDNTKTLIVKNESPDIPFNAGINPYRGCEHGCIYCYARPSHEYLGLSAGLDFESKIFVKMKAPEILNRELSRKGYQPEHLALSGNTDAYQPAEKKFQLTRKCLEVLNSWNNPVSLITKNYLITRDADLLAEMATKNLVNVMISLTSLNDDLRKTMEPRTSSPLLRLKAIEKLSSLGIPTGVLIGPIIPGLTDHEIPSLLKAAESAGATCAGYIMLRLPYSVKNLFSDWLEKYFPESKLKILHQIQSVRGGKLNDSEYKSRMRGTGFLADQIAAIFNLHCQKLNLSRKFNPLSIDNFGKGREKQLSLF